jgi:hypothetical protein
VIPFDFTTEWRAEAPWATEAQVEQDLVYQRKRGRDLFDLLIASRRATVSPARVVECFSRYLEHDGQRVTRAEFEMNVHEKLADDTFLSDVARLVGLLGSSAARRLHLLSRLPTNGGSYYGAPSGALCFSGSRKASEVAQFTRRFAPTRGWPRAGPHGA